MFYSSYYVVVSFPRSPDLYLILLPQINRIKYWVNPGPVPAEGNPAIFT